MSCSGRARELASPGGNLSQVAPTGGMRCPALMNAVLFLWTRLDEPARPSHQVVKR